MFLNLYCLPSDSLNIACDYCLWLFVFLIKIRFVYCFGLFVCYIVFVFVLYMFFWVLYGILIFVLCWGSDYLGSLCILCLKVVSIRVSMYFNTYFVV